MDCGKIYFTKGELGLHPPLFSSSFCSFYLTQPPLSIRFLGKVGSILSINLICFITLPFWLPEQIAACLYAHEGKGSRLYFVILLKIHSPFFSKGHVSHQSSSYQINSFLNAKRGVLPSCTFYSCSISSVARRLQPSGHVFQSLAVVFISPQKAFC